VTGRDLTQPARCAGKKPKPNLNHPMNTIPLEPMNNTDLPTDIAGQLADLETRHKAHQRMLQRHHDAKHERRDAHRRRKITQIPITLI
jgi:hypothetical protein